MMNAQSYAYGINHWTLDPDLRPVLAQYWGDLARYEDELSRFGELAGGRAYLVAQHVDQYAPPVLQAHDLDGKRIDRAQLCPEHAALLKEMAFINRPPYSGGNWLHHYALGYLLADPGLYCSLIVTNQTAYAIYKYAPQHIGWLEPLLSGQMWGATWMTETHGGSDLGANLTQAQFTPDGWRLDGDYKYFASNAGLADLALATARPKGAPPGPKGIALFLVPRLDNAGWLNFFVRRLKVKSGTRAVPTGEVEFKHSQAFLVGEAELGIYYTLENLTVSRLANAVGAMGLALLLSFSRGSFVGAGAALALLGAVRYRKLLVIGVVALALILVLPQTQGYVTHFFDGLQVLSDADASDLSTQMRVGEYSDAIKLIERYPLFGVGFTGTPDIDTYLKVANLYLLMAGEMGLIGLGSFLVVMSVLFVSAWRARPQRRLPAAVPAAGSDVEPIWWGFHAALVGALIGGLFDHYFFNLDFHHSVTLFWLFVGLAAVSTRLKPGRRDV